MLYFRFTSFQQFICGLFITLLISSQVRAADKIGKLSVASNNPAVRRCATALYNKNISSALINGVANGFEVSNVFTGINDFTDGLLEFAAIMNETTPIVVNPMGPVVAMGVRSLKSNSTESAAISGLGMLAGGLSSFLGAYKNLEVYRVNFEDGKHLDVLVQDTWFMGNSIVEKKMEGLHESMNLIEANSSTYEQKASQPLSKRICTAASCVLWLSSPFLLAHDLDISSLSEVQNDLLKVLISSASLGAGMYAFFKFRKFRQSDSDYFINKTIDEEVREHNDSDLVVLHIREGIGLIRESLAKRGAVKIDTKEYVKSLVKEEVEKKTSDMNEDEKKSVFARIGSSFDDLWRVKNSKDQSSQEVSGEENTRSNLSWLERNVLRKKPPREEEPEE